MTTRPATVNFRLYPGATFAERTVLKDGAGVPLDLTGYTALMHVRRELEDETPLFTLTSEGASPTITLGGVAGTIDLDLTPTATGAPVVDWDGEVWVYDLLLTNATASPAVVDRVFQGRIFVFPGVTRSA